SGDAGRVAIDEIHDPVHVDAQVMGPVPLQVAARLEQVAPDPPWSAAFPADEGCRQDDQAAVEVAAAPPPRLFQDLMAGEVMSLVIQVQEPLQGSRNPARKAAGPGAVARIFRAPPARLLRLLPETSFPWPGGTVLVSSHVILPPQANRCRTLSGSCW